MEYSIKNFVSTVGTHTIVAIIFFICGAVTWWFLDEMIITRIIIPYGTYVAAFVLGILVTLLIIGITVIAE